MSVTVDPRAASSAILSGPTDLVGDKIVPIGLVEVDGITVGVPRLMPGVRPRRRRIRTVRRHCGSSTAAARFRASTSARLSTFG